MQPAPDSEKKYIQFVLILIAEQHLHSEQVFIIGNCLK